MYEEGEDAGGKAALVAAIRDFCGDALRDIWLFDQEDHESLYIRDDVSEKIESVEVEQYIDNERYGFVTRATYKQLYYADYEYTVRGFDQFDQFRTFLVEETDRKIGVFVSIDRPSTCHDYGALHAHLRDIAATYPETDLIPDY